MNDSKKKWTAETWIQAAGLIAAVVAVLVTVFFSIRSERSKELSVTVLAKRPLISVETSNPNSGLEVKLKGAAVTAPWLVSIRVQNTGGLSIEERDIESPLRLFFQGAKPISAEIQSRSDQSISSTATFAEDSVTISHKLLNPSDWLTVDVLFDGEPKIPPTALARISGVTNPKTFSLKSTDDSKTRFVPFSLPMPVVYTALVLASVLAISGVVGGIVFGYQTIKEAVAPPRLSRATASSDLRLQRLDPIGSASRLVRPVTDTGRILYAALGERDATELLSDPNSLFAALKQLPNGLLLSLGHDEETAAETIKRELLNGLKESVSQKLYLMLPSGKDRAASEAMRAIDVQDMTPHEIVERGRLLMQQFTGQNPERAPMDKEDLVGAFSFIVFGLALGLVSFGGWRVVLG